MQPIFIFDTNILNDLEENSDRRVEFIHQAVYKIHTQLQQVGAGLDVRVGDPVKIFSDLLKEYPINCVFTNFHSFDRLVEEFPEVRNIFNTVKLLRPGTMQGPTFDTLVNYFKYDDSLLVLEYNNLICNKKKWKQIQIKNQDKIEIVTIVGGG